MRTLFLILLLVALAVPVTVFAQDMDGDGIVTEVCTPVDNCPDVYNPAQGDCDSDGIGDECDESSGCPDTDTDTGPEPDTDTEIDTDTEVLGSVGEGCPVRSEYYNYHSEIDSDHILGIINDGQQQNENVVMIAGDSISTSNRILAYYLGNFEYPYGDVDEVYGWIGIKDLGCFPELVEPLDYFLEGATFTRDSIAQGGGLTAAGVLSGSPSRLQQEIDAINPQYGIVMFGSNDVYGINAATEEYRIHEKVEDIMEITEVMEEQGIVPIVLSSFTHIGYEEEMNLMSGFLEAACSVAKVTFVNLHDATWPLIDHGLRDSQHPSIFQYNRSCVFNDETLTKGANLHNLLTLQALSRIYEVVQ